MTAPRERPLLFSGPMVRAILEGRKTQTRRVIHRPPYVHGEPNFYGPEWWVGPHPDGGWWATYPGPPPEWVKRRTSGGGFPCPYGQPGESRLWVREAWAPNDPPSGYIYKADDASGHASRIFGVKWRPSIFMPRSVSRLTLELTDVRVQRLQEISEEDARAEGCQNNHTAKWPSGDPGFIHDVHRRNFARLWDEINAKRGYPWESNPWVWALTFKVVS